MRQAAELIVQNGGKRFGAGDRTCEISIYTGRKIEREKHIERRDNKMKSKDFFKFVEEFRRKEDEIYAQKSLDYMSEDDQFQNFREVSQFVGVDKALDQVCFLYLLKHIQSIGVALKSKTYTWAWTTGPEGSGEGLKQRIADARNYLLLLAACLEESEEKKNVL